MVQFVPEASRVFGTSLLSLGRPNGRWSWLPGLLFLLLLTAGCGSSREDYVAIGGAPSGERTGSVAFQFARAQTALQVPENSANIRFRFYNSPGGLGNLLFDESRPYAPTITFDAVDPTVRSAVVTVSSQDGAPLLQATVNFTVVVGDEVVVDFANAIVVPITSQLQVSPASITIGLGQTQQYSAVLRYSNGTVRAADSVLWSAQGGATITASGLATGTAEGQATITATRGALTGQAVLTVSAQDPVLTTLRVSPQGASVGVGGTVEFSASGQDQFGQAIGLGGGSVTWTVSGSAASIEANSGVALALAPGQVTVTASLGNVRGDSTLQVVAVDSELVGLAVSPSPLSLNLDAGADTAALNATGTFSAGPSRQLDSGDGLFYQVTGPSGVVNVTADGWVTALAQGNTSITASIGALNTTVQVSVAFGSGGNSDPMLVIDSYPLLLPPQPTSQRPFYNATVSDFQQASLQGGRLTVRVVGEEWSVNQPFLFPPSSSIGLTEFSPTADGSEFVISLNASATVTAVQTFLRSVAFEGGSANDYGHFEVLLTDGQGGETNVTRSYSVVAAGATYSANGSFENVTETVGVETYLLSDEGGSTPTVEGVAMGFDFRLLTQTVTELSISNNGALFLGSAPDSFPEEIPSYGRQGLLVAPYWFDFSPTSAVYVATLGGAPYRRRVFQFENYAYGNGPGTATFQVVFHETINVLDFNYGPNPDNGEGASIGVQHIPTEGSPVGAQWLYWSHDGYRQVPGGTRLRMSIPGSWPL